MEDHNVFFSGSLIEVQAMQSKLDAAGIQYIIKNNINSATMAGFGTISESVDVLLLPSDFELAKAVLER
jgi:hypothetical protein